MELNQGSPVLEPTFAHKRIKTDLKNARVRCIEEIETINICNTLGRVTLLQHLESQRMERRLLLHFGEHWGAVWYTVENMRHLVRHLTLQACILVTIYRGRIGHIQDKVEIVGKRWGKCQGMKRKTYMLGRKVTGVGSTGCSNWLDVDMKGNGKY